MWDCCCIKSKQINASWKYRHKGKKKEGEKKMGFILFLLLKYKEHVAKVGHLHILQPYQHHRKKPFFFPRISDLEYL